MLEQLHQIHAKEVEDFLGQAPGFALFIIGDIENFGYDSSFQTIWGDRDDHGALQAVLLRYYTNYVIYAPGAYDAERVAAKIQENSEWTNINGWAEAIRQVMPYVEEGESKEMYFAECKELERAYPIPESVVEADFDDIEGILTLRGTIQEFSQSKDGAKLMRHKMETKSGREVICKIDGKVVAGAATTAENSQSAMVVAVCTDPAYRKHGYASACVTKLAKDYVVLGKRLYLFYDNPNAGRIYNRIGFHEIGKYTMIQR
ncbi:GNAT family N-acetyltransferase [Gottschalkiaceae bacterium SANA]|nr:GNAT family N-acetyltransferase [Gottschalkiaceae bacterium SANA]